MKIALFDPNGYKFTRDMMAHWRSQGHEVKEEFYYNPELVDWADVTWFETCDNNIYRATINEKEEFQLSHFKNKWIICRPIDIDVWSRHYMRVDWSMINEIIFIANHIKAEVDRDLPNVGERSHVIPCGVNTNDYPLKADLSRGKNVAWVAHRWDAKGIDYFLQYAAMLYQADPEYHITAVGTWSDGIQSGWYRQYIDQFIRENPMNIEFIERVDDMNEFLETQHFAICFSKKEGFSYSIAEGMSRGLKPIIHNFYGCGDIWPKEYTWNTVNDAVMMTITGGWDPEEYRRWVKEHYDLSIMLKEFDKLIERRPHA
jgi:glycosyltransferase involved in cell wall biosynthesis